MKRVFYELYIRLWYALISSNDLFSENHLKIGPLPEATLTESDRRFMSVLVGLCQFWAHLVGFGRIRSDSVGFGQIWLDLVGFSFFENNSVNLVGLGRIWSDAVGFGRTRSDLVGFGWTRSDQSQ